MPQGVEHRMLRECWATLGAGEDSIDAARR